MDLFKELSEIFFEVVIFIIGIGTICLVGWSIYKEFDEKMYISKNDWVCTQYTDIPVTHIIGKVPTTTIQPVCTQYTTK